MNFLVVVTPPSIYHIQYTPGAKNILAGFISRLPSNIQPKSTHQSNYITETLLEMYEVEKLPDGTLPLKCTTINHYQRYYPGIKIQVKKEYITYITNKLLNILEILLHIVQNTV